MRYSVHQLAWLVCIVALCVVSLSVVAGADLWRVALAVILLGTLTVLIARGSVLNGK